MDQPVNFVNLREITGGDATLETELFKAFIDAADTCMKNLRAACAAGDESAWRREAHAFKGICFNLGAEPLGALCKRAQEDAGALPDEKQDMLAAMETELVRVRAAIGEQK